LKTEDSIVVETKHDNEIDSESPPAERFWVEHTNTLEHGTLSEGEEGLSTVDLLIKVLVLLGKVKDIL
jgi:hypothetical protein